jgi:predicted RNA-binding Zn-ribbon protein involved in translation (DUF1610 family)
VKNQKHEHTLKLIGSRYFEPDCFLCGERIVGKFGKSSNVLYSCKHCGKEFHLKCIMSTVKFSQPSCRTLTINFFRFVFGFQNI